MRFRILLQLDRFEDDDVDEAEPVEITNTEIHAEGKADGEALLTLAFSQAEQLLRARVAASGLEPRS